MPILRFDSEETATVRYLQDRLGEARAEAKVARESAAKARNRLDEMVDEMEAMNAYRSEQTTLLSDARERERIAEDEMAGWRRLAERLGGEEAKRNLLAFAQDVAQPYDLRRQAAMAVIYQETPEFFEEES